ncbi:MAG: hypothetical protein ACREQM_16960 [Candidatus Dormibacteraceae bacterium]
MSDRYHPPDQDDDEQEGDAFATMEGRVRQATEVAQEVAVAAIPPGVPATWQEIAHQELVGAILRDWSKNGTEELVDEDTTNLTAFTRIAAGAGTSAPMELRDATFVAVLRALLEDWVANWSGDDDEADA